MKDGMPITGARQFMAAIQETGPGAKSIKNWIYLPGNHDYLVWTLLSNKMIYVDTLTSGNRLNVKRSSLKEGIWKRGTAFISGIFPPEIRKRVTVEYPDHVIRSNGRKIVITHGHYLDPKQTLFKRLKELLHETGDQKKAIERMYVETDRFQVVANALTYSSELQRYMNYVLRTGRFAQNLSLTIGKYVGVGKNSTRFPVSPLRDEQINLGQLRAAEFYLKYFRNYKRAPDYFIYGHTHRRGISSTDRIPEKKRLYPEKAINVHNTGAFLTKKGVAASFIRIDVPQDGNLRITPVKIYSNGKISSQLPSGNG
ncbi:MAG: hypothetical protein R6U50_18720 [Desulfobacterales bacterium]